MEAGEIGWVRRAREGDAEAFRCIVEAYSRTLWKAAYRVLGDAEAAEDAVQETFLRAWKALGRFDEQAELSTWLYRIAVNAAIDQRRGRRRRAHVSVAVPEEMDLAAVTPTGEPDPQRRALSSEVAERARAAIAELPPNERTAFLLRHYEGRSIAEIARALEKSENAAKQTVFRAVRKLRQALGAWTEISHGEPA